MKIKTLRIGKGRTTKSSEDVEEWVKKYFEVEIELPENITEETLQEARAKAEAMIDAWLTETAVALPKIDMAQIEELPWKRYKDKQPCEPGETGWILANTQGAEELVKAIKASPNEKLELPPYEFTFSGKEKQFIRRVAKR